MLSLFSMKRENIIIQIVSNSFLFEIISSCVSDLNFLFNMTASLGTYRLITMEVKVASINQENNSLGVFIGVSWPSGLAYRTQVLVLAAECGFESRP